MAPDDQPAVDVSKDGLVTRLVIVAVATSEIRGVIVRPEMFASGAPAETGVSVCAPSLETVPIGM